MDNREQCQELTQQVARLGFGLGEMASLAGESGACSDEMSLILKRAFQGVRPLKAEPAQENPMDDHSELLKDARELAMRIDMSIVRGELDNHLGLMQAIAPIVRALADIVESYTNERAARIQEREKRTATLEGRLDNYLAERSNTVTELVAACKTCDTEISTLLGSSPDIWGSALWNRLRAARHLAVRAAKLGEPEGDHVEATTKLVQDEYGDLMKRLADNPATNQASNAELWSLWSQIAPRLQRALGLAPPSLEEAEVISMTDEEIEHIVECATNQAPNAEQPAPAIEVEMRCEGHPHGGLTWQCCLMGVWIAAYCYSDDAQAFLVFPTTEDTQRHGERWLTDLSEQLGVTLMPVWKDGE